MLNPGPLQYKEITIEIGLPWATYLGKYHRKRKSMVLPGYLRSSLAGGYNVSMNSIG